MPHKDEAKDQPTASKPTQQLRFSLRLLGAELLWQRTPAPPGIELRDYLAAQALAGYMFHVSEESGGLLLAKVARIAYRMADEMLKARGHRQEHQHPPSESSLGDSNQRPGIK